MRGPGGVFTISMTVLASLAIMAACAPNANRTRVITTSGVRTGQAFDKLIQQCSSLGAGSRVEAKAKVHEIQSCVASDKIQPSGQHLYKSFKEQVEFRGSRKGKGLAVSLRLGLDFPEKMTSDQANMFKDKIDAHCVAPFTQLWKESIFGNKIELDLKTVLVGTEADDSYDFDIPLSFASSDDENLQLVMDRWPDMGTMQIHRPDEDKVACEKLYPGQTRMISNCRQSKYLARNQRFCANFAVMVGHALGLSQPLAEAGRCQEYKGVAATSTEDSEGSAKPEPKSTGQNSGQSSRRAQRLPFMAQALDPKVNEKNFFETVRLSEADFKSVIGQVCGNVTDRK